MILLLPHQNDSRYGHGEEKENRQTLLSSGLTVCNKKSMRQDFMLLDRRSR